MLGFIVGPSMGAVAELTSIEAPSRIAALMGLVALVAGTFPPGRHGATRHPRRVRSAARCATAASSPPSG